MAGVGDHIDRAPGWGAHGADEMIGTDSRWGPFELGKRYVEVEPGLGGLHEAWHVRTGKAALVLLPGEGVEWQFQGRWQVRLSVQPELPSLALQVEEAPGSARARELADLLVLMTAAIQRVEDSPRMRSFLDAEPVPHPDRNEAGAGHAGRSWPVGALAGVAALLLGLGVWLHVERAPRSSALLGARGALFWADAFYGSAEQSADHQSVAYSLPTRPFRNQTTAPCNTRRGEVAINTGCWIALKQRPPCLDDQAEYQGECYLPILKAERPPQAAQP